jgi:ketosteroid isomerase-like protein
LVIELPVTKEIEMRTFMVAAVLSVSIIVFSAGGLVAEDASKELWTTIESLSTELDRLMIEGDFKTMLSYYTDDVICMPNYSPMLKGKKALKRHLAKTQNDGVEFRSFSSTTVDLWSCGDLVYETGTYGLSISHPDLNRPFADHGKFLTIWEKQSDGSYKVKYSIWNTDVNWGQQ